MFLGNPGWQVTDNSHSIWKPISLTGLWVNRIFSQIKKEKMGVAIFFCVLLAFSLKRVWNRSGSVGKSFSPASIYRTTTPRCLKPYLLDFRRTCSIRIRVKMGTYFFLPENCSLLDYFFINLRGKAFKGSIFLSPSSTHLHNDSPFQTINNNRSRKRPLAKFHLGIIQSWK